MGTTDRLVNDPIDQAQGFQAMGRDSHGFGGIAGTRFPGAGPDNSEHVEWVKLSTLTFFDTYLKNCQEAAQFLLDGDLAELSSALNITHR